MKLRSRRLNLTPISSKDYPFYQQLYSDPELMEFIMPLAEQSKTQRSFELLLQRHHQEKNKRMLMIIRKNESEDPIGIIGLSWKHVIEPEAELGTVIVTSGQRQGYAQEARLLLLNHAFSEFNLERVVGYTDTNNEAINKLNSKWGSVKEKVYYNSLRQRQEIKWVLTFDNLQKALEAQTEVNKGNCVI